MISFPLSLSHTLYPSLSLPHSISLSTQIPRNPYPIFIYSTELRFTNEKQMHKDIVIDLTKCTPSKPLLVCQLNEITFPVRVVTIGTDGISRLAFRGKTGKSIWQCPMAHCIWLVPLISPTIIIILLLVVVVFSVNENKKTTVFYPTLTAKASVNLKDNLKLTCTVNQCDRSVHSDCSEKAMRSGVQIDCSNKRLLRMPMNNNADDYVIVSQGKMDKEWSKTKFEAETNEMDQLVVSMPRSECVLVWVLVGVGVLVCFGWLDCVCIR